MTHQQRRAAPSHNEHPTPADLARYSSILDSLGRRLVTYAGQIATVPSGALKAHRIDRIAVTAFRASETMIALGALLGVYRSLTAVGDKNSARAITVRYVESRRDVISRDVSIAYRDGFPFEDRSSMEMQLWGDYQSSMHNAIELLREVAGRIAGS